MGEYSLYNPSTDGSQDSLAHYGRLGMKWYQHIYGEYQGAAKYAEKGEKKLSALKSKNAKLVGSIDTQVAKNDKLQGKHALKAAKYRAAQKDEKSIKEDVLAAKYGAKSASLRNTKQKALDKEDKLSKNVDRVKNAIKELENKYNRVADKLLINAMLFNGMKLDVNSKKMLDYLDSLGVLDKDNKDTYDDFIKKGAYEQ